MQQLAPSHLLKQRYRILASVGQGGMGAVYRAEDTQLGNRKVAVKEMSQNGLSPQEIAEATENFKREALLLAGLMHPNLPRIYDHFNEAGRWYLVMDFIDGETLEAYLAQAKGGKLSVEEVLHIGIQLCTVLNYLHTQQPPIIFRDLKPANIMLSPEGHVYLVDFGIARHFKPGQAKDTIAFGSSGYAAPEQYGRTQTTPRSDIYGLGAVLHQLITGDDPSLKPFKFTPLTALPAPFDLGVLIMQMVEMDADKRPTSAKDVEGKLQVIVTQLSQHISPLQPAAPINPPSPQVQPKPNNPNVRPVAGQPVANNPPSPNMQPGQQILLPPQPNPNIQLKPVPVSQLRITRKQFLIGVVAVATGVFSLYKLLEASQVEIYDGGDSQSVTSIAWSPDSKRIASASDDVKVWDANSGQTLLTYTGHPVQIVGAVAWSPDGKRIASASASFDETVQVWGASSGRTLLTYHGYFIPQSSFSGVTAVAWSPDGKRIASANNDVPGQNVQVWDANSGQTLLTYTGHSSAVTAVAWSPDGKRIASGGDYGDNTVQVWDAADGGHVYTYQGHSNWVNAVAWSPDSKRIASGSQDTTVQVWDAADGGHVYTYQGHTRWVLAVAWSPDGRHIASGSADYTVQVWSAE